MAANWASIQLPTLVYVGIKDRAEFDKLDKPATEHVPDAKLMRGMRCLSKVVRDADSGVMVIFQHWISEPAETPAASS